MTRRTSASTSLGARKFLAATAAMALGLSGFIAVNTFNAPGAQAVAEGLPTWDDVQAAKNNEAAAAQKVAEIEGLIIQVQNQVEATRQAADIAAMKLIEAEAELRKVEERLAALEAQAASSQAEAEAATEQAAALVSQLYRSGGVDRSLSLFLESDGSTADALLDNLASIEKATERNTAVSEEAEQAMNSAKSLSEQTASARAERDRLRAEAEVNRIAAAEAAEAARSELIQQEANQETLQAQLAALKDTTSATVAGFEERLALERAERERQEREAAEAARRAAEAAAAAAAAGGGGGAAASGGGGGGGSWVRPLSCCYWVSAELWGYYGHEGIDLAAAGWTPIYAASSGTVSYSGWFGGYGNAVFINHGGGVQTRYAHMITSPVVGYGQWVNAGQLIGYVGSTGFSTGNHLHFETRVNGSVRNPRDFLSL